MTDWRRRRAVGRAITLNRSIVSTTSLSRTRRFRWHHIRVTWSSITWPIDEAAAARTSAQAWN